MKRKRKKQMPVTRATIVKLQQRIAKLEKHLRWQIEDHAMTNLALNEATTFVRRDERAVKDAFARDLQNSLNDVYKAMHALSKQLDDAICGPFPLVRPELPPPLDEVAETIARLKRESNGPDTISPDADAD